MYTANANRIKTDNEIVGKILDIFKILEYIFLKMNLDKYFNINPGQLISYSV